MLRRLRGLFIIIRALLPVLLVVGATIITWLAAQSVVEATGDYGDDLAVQLAEIEAAIDTANDGLEAMGSYVTSSAEAAEELLASVGALKDNVEIILPAVDIPDFAIPIVDVVIGLPEFQLGDGILTIPIPGVEPLQSLANELADAGRRAIEPVLKVGALADVPPQLEQAAEDSVQYAGDIRSIVGGWLTALFILLLLGGLIWVVAALRPITSELGRGWSMVIGRSEPERAVTDLEKRVRELERRLEGP